MGKASKVKGELLDVKEMVELVQTLKDIADNKLFTLMNEKNKFRRFGQTFVEFFRMISLTEKKHPMIENDNKKVGILAVSIEGSFLGEFNNKILRTAIEEKEKYEDVKLIAVGNKAEARFREIDQNIRAFNNMEAIGIYETVIMVKDYLVDEIMNDRLGKVLVVYAWPKSFDTQLRKVVQLLPCVDLLKKQHEFVDIFDEVIEESDPMQVIGILTNLWVSTRLYEIFIDTIIASASAQSSFLEDSVDKMKKERTKVGMKYIKAKKGDIDKSLRETFSARMMTMK